MLCLIEPKSTKSLDGLHANVKCYLFLTFEMEELSPASWVSILLENGSCFSVLRQKHINKFSCAINSRVQHTRIC